jgi:hypothetical protein
MVDTVGVVAFLLVAVFAGAVANEDKCFGAVCVVAQAVAAVAVAVGAVGVGAVSAVVVLCYVTLAPALLL